MTWQISRQRNILAIGGHSPAVLALTVDLFSHRMRRNCYFRAFGSTFWFTAYSLPCQFSPRSESANRTLANSLPGTFAPGANWPGNFCSLLSAWHWL